MTSHPYGQLPSGDSVESHTLSNAQGAFVQVLSYGGIVTKLCVPDRAGVLADVVLGFDKLEDYLTSDACFGAMIGRIAGRVAEGHFTLSGRRYSLVCNNGTNHLHGGNVGLNRRLWTVKSNLREDGADSLALHYHSPDGEEGYPGNVDITVKYTLTEANELVIETEANSDQITPLSLTHHSYFNLSGENTGPVTQHELQIFADSYVPTDENLTLLNRIEAVTEGNNFRQPRSLAEAIPSLHQSHGDLYFIQRETSATPVTVAKLSDPLSGRVLTVLTTEHYLQLYTATGLDGRVIGKSGDAYERHAGICLECEGYPNAVSSSDLDDILINPGQPQRRTTIYAFSNN